MPEHEASQSRNEAILQNILGEHNELLEPQSRNEAILQAILYGDSYTEDAQSRIETLLLCILNGTTTDLQPLSRNEEILIAKINGGTYDKEPQSRIEALLIEWLNAFVEKTVTGAVCSFDDAISGQPFIDLTAEIVPQQASGTPTLTNPLPISGYTSGTITVCGKNLISVIEQGGIDATNGRETSSNTRVRTGYIKVSPSTQFAVAVNSTNTNLVVFHVVEYGQANDTTFISASGKNTASATFTTSANTQYIRITARDTTSIDITPTDLSKWQLEKDSTSTTFEPFNGQTESRSFGQTVYGVEWKATQGKVVDGYDLLEFSSVSSVATSSGGVVYWIMTTGLSSINGAVMSDYFKKSPTVEAGNSYVTGSGNILVACPTDQTLNTKALADAWCATNKPHFLVPLATPTEITVGPVNFTAREGVNNIYSNTGNTTVKYKARG